MRFPRVVLVALMLGNVMAGRAESKPVTSLAEMRYEGVVKQAWDLSCGAAAIATLLSYDYGDQVSEREAAEAMLRRTDPLKVRFQGGFSFLDLQRFAQSRGYVANGYGNVGLEDLRQMSPSIVPISVHGYDHFVVVRKIDGHEVIFADSAFGNRVLSVSEFEKSWKLNVAFVVEETPDSNSADRDAPDQHSAPSASPGETSVENQNGRALERALVRVGAMVLPPWVTEVEPRFGYVYDEYGDQQLDAIRSALALRLGLPWALQTDVELPYVMLQSLRRQEQRSGFGDIDFGISKLLLLEGASTPELVLRGSWRLPTGRIDGVVPVGTGTHAIGATVSASKRNDPLVFFGNLFHIWDLPSGNFDRGNTLGGNLGGLLAATPSTSVQLSVELTWYSSTQIGGQRLPGTDRLSGIQRLGVSTIIGRNTLLNVGAQVGFVAAAPNFQFDIALPIRF